MITLDQARAAERFTQTLFPNCKTDISRQLGDYYAVLVHRVREPGDPPAIDGVPIVYDPPAPITRLTDTRFHPYSCPVTTDQRTFWIIIAVLVLIFLSAYGAVLLSAGIT